MERTVLAIVLVGLQLWGLSAAIAADAEPWIEPRCRPLVVDKLGPFVRLADGSVLTVDGKSSYVSRDDGKTWSPPRPLFREGQDFKVSDERALLRTREGTIVLAFANVNEKVWNWSPEKKDALPGTRLPAYVMRSLNDGQTWQDLTKVHDEWTGATRDMIQTRDGRIVFVTQKLLTSPGRHAVLTYSSGDEGKSWQASNLIDLGGNGHHGGVCEGTFAQLKDGRVWMLIRTNWDRFWEAFSDDDGRSWRTIRPSTIDASSAPGILTRLESGRLLLVWNRLYPEGKSTYPRVGGDGQWSEVLTSNHREELSLAFSEDDGATWTEPVVIVRHAGKWVSYPYVYEHRPGEIWLTMMQHPVRLKIREADFIGP